jgi:hypothetical protein
MGRSTFFRVGCRADPTNDGDQVIRANTAVEFASACSRSLEGLTAQKTTRPWTYDKLSSRGSQPSLMC